PTGDDRERLLGLVLAGTLHAQHGRPGRPSGRRHPHGRHQLAGATGAAAVSHLYTPQEDEYIRRWVPTRGYTLVAKKLGRSRGGVWHRAKKLGVKFGEIEGWTRTKDLAAATHQSQSAVWFRAKREGVLRQVGPKSGGQRSRAALVPNKWADAILAEYQQLAAGESLAETAGWLTLDEVAAIWRIG